jgi:hypothetical protein
MVDGINGLVQLVLAVAAVILAIMYIGGPLLIWFTFRIRGVPAVRPVDVNEMPPQVYEHFGRTAPTLADLGFELVTYLHMTKQVDNLQSYFALWVNVCTGQSAGAIVIFGPRLVRYVEFQTTSADGTIVETGNSTEVGCFRKLPHKKSMHAVGECDLQRLYRLHQIREAKYIGTHEERFLPLPGTEVEQILRETDLELRWQMRAGFFHACEQMTIYTPTLLGAILMTWTQLFPISQFRRYLQRRRARLEMEQGEAVGISPPAKVAITHRSPYPEQSLGGFPVQPVVAATAQAEASRSVSS